MDRAEAVKQAFVLTSRMASANNVYPTIVEFTDSVAFLAKWMLGEEEETWELDDTIDEQHRFERVEAMRCHHASE